MKQAVPEGPYILAIETASPIGSVGIFSGDVLLAYSEIRRAKSHARLLMPMIKTLIEDISLNPKDLSAIAVAKGPGSYTGLRVGVSTAKGLCMALDKPLLSISSLESLAWQVRDLAHSLNAWICPMLDARRMEVYCCLYDAEMIQKTDIKAKIIKEDAFHDVLEQRKVIFVGDAVAKCMEVLGNSPSAILLPETLCSAKGMGKSIYQIYQKKDFEDLVTFEPFYLKDFVATKPRNLLQ